MSPAHYALIGVGVAASLATFAGAPRGPRPHPVTTIWDSVYTEAQAARGARTYAEVCGTCHGRTGEGSPHAGSLIGTTLDRRWAGKPLGAYYLVIRDQMPPGQPGSLSNRATAAVLARVLQLHGAPAGARELTFEQDSLDRIWIVPRPDSAGGSPAHYTPAPLLPTLQPTGS